MYKYERMWEPVHTLVTMSSSAYSARDDPPRDLQRDVERWLSSMGLTSTVGADFQHPRSFSVKLVDESGALLGCYDCWIERQATDEERTCLRNFLREWVDESISIDIQPNNLKRARPLTRDTIDLDSAQGVDPEEKKDEHLQRQFFYGTFSFKGTLENYRQWVSRIMDSTFDSWRAQVEVGEQDGHEHVQWVGRAKKRSTKRQIVSSMRAILDPPGITLQCHVEICEKSRLLAKDGLGAYCSKALTRMAGTLPIERNFDEKTLGKSQGKRSDLLAIAEMIRGLPDATTMSKKDKIRVLYDEFPAHMLRMPKNLEKMVEFFHEPPVPVEDRVPRDWQRDMLERLSETPNDRQIFWIWGHVGNVGKSTLISLARARSASQPSFGRVCLLGSKAADIGFEYDYERVVFFDVPRNADHAVLDEWKRVAESMKNGSLNNPKWSSSTKYFKPPHIVFLSNLPPPLDSVWTADRVIEINLDHL